MTMSKKVNWETIIFSPAGVLILVLIPVIIVGAVMLNAAQDSAERVEKSAISTKAQQEETWLKNTDFAYSSDKSKVVFVRDIGDHRLSEDFAEGTDVYNQLILKDIDSGKEQVIVQSGKLNALSILDLPEDGFPIDKLIDIGTPIFSIDDKSIYFTAAGWVTSSAIFSYDVSTSKLRFVSDGQSVGVITTGTYRGNLLLLQHRYYGPPEYGSYDHFYITTTSGDEVLDVGNWDEQDTIFEKYGIH